MICSDPGGRLRSVKTLVRSTVKIPHPSHLPHPIESLPDEPVVNAVKEGIDAAMSIAMVNRPWVMISVNDDKEDLHFRKAGIALKFDPEDCPSDCPRPCEKGGVITERCYGCGRCFPICPYDKISGYRVVPNVIGPLSERVPSSARYDRCKRATSPHSFSPRSPCAEKKSPHKALARSPYVQRRFLLPVIAKDSPHEAPRSSWEMDRDPGEQRRISRFSHFFSLFFSLFFFFPWLILPNSSRRRSKSTVTG
ncbi:hypothetical protein B296_00026092 [Ensete ventricosum]|uniref:4Fe-4S ferredoxin-type domain-containing protein n=1 Tax=Ensete ventricosum TaxID=4639 RepID=A0A426ZUP4_ENSVE|nr:hypothetical protein B296_00026092 [Ensete ventricosum]